MSLGRKGSSLIKRRKSSGSLTSTCSGETISSQGEDDGINSVSNDRPASNTTRNGIITNGSVSYASNERRFRESTTSGPNSVDSGFSSFSSSSSGTSSSTKRVREITGNRKIKRCKSLTRPRVPPPPPPVPKSSTPVPPLQSSTYVIDDSGVSKVNNAQKASIPIPPPLPTNLKIDSGLPISSSKNAKESGINDITYAIPNHLPQIPRDCNKVAISSIIQAENCNSVSLCTTQLAETLELNPEVPTLADINTKPESSLKVLAEEDIKSADNTSSQEAVKPMSTFNSVHSSNTLAPSSMTITPSSFVGLSSLPKSAMKMSALPFGSTSPTVSQQSVFTCSSPVVVDIPKSSSSSMLNSFTETSPGANKLSKSPSVSSMAASSKLAESAELSKAPEMNPASPSLANISSSSSAADDVRRILSSASDYSLPRILSGEGARYSEVRSPSPPPLPTTSPPPLTPTDEEKIIVVKPDAIEQTKVQLFMIFSFWNLEFSDL
jgi:hypothetical protein